MAKVFKKGKEASVPKKVTIEVKAVVSGAEAKRESVCKLCGEPIGISGAREFRGYCIKCLNAVSKERWEQSTDGDILAEAGANHRKPREWFDLLRKTSDMKATVEYE